MERSGSLSTVSNVYFTTTHALTPVTPGQHDAWTLGQLTLGAALQERRMEPRRTAIIAEDEAPARKRLQTLLADVPWIDVVAACEDGPSTVEAVDRLEPDALFLDLQMPGCDGLQVLERVTHVPAVIFTTAHDQYAVTGFELGAVDYLLKPFGRDRLGVALERLRGVLARGPDASVLDRAMEALAATSRPLTRLFIRARDRILVVPVGKIQRFEARDDYTAAFTDAQYHLIHIGIRDLERRLDPGMFVRIHRSHIVNLACVDALLPTPDSRLEVLLKDGTRLLASRSRSRELRALSV